MPAKLKLNIELNGTGSDADNTTSGYVADTPMALFTSSPVVTTSNTGSGNAHAGDLLSITFQLNAGDTLSLNPTSKFTLTAGPGTDQYTLTYSASAANYSDSAWTTALSNLVFTGTNTYNATSPDLITIASTTSRSGAAYSNLTIGNETVTCFYPGTMIRTPDGEVAVETLKHGDLVLTHDGRAVAANWIGRQTVALMFAPKMRVLPIRIKAGALGDNSPTRDLLVSPDHALLVGGVLIHAGALVNGTSIVRETAVPKVFTYYHVETDDHSLILAEGAAAETFVDNVDRLGFDNWDEYEALYPQGKSIKELPYPRAKAHRQVPVYLRVMLAERAMAIGAAAANVA